MNLYDIYKGNKFIPFDFIGQDLELSQHIQVILVSHKLLNPPADGRFGLISKTALKEFQSLNNNSSSCLDKSLAELLIETKPNTLNRLTNKNENNPVLKLVDYCVHKGYKLFRNPGEVNIIYLEGCNTNFTLNTDKPNLFNDLKLILQFVDKEPIITYKSKSSTEPGSYYTHNPMNKGGAARLAMGQHLNAWCVGTHLAGKRTAHESLVQVAPVNFYRDLNKDFKRIGDKLYCEVIGLNQHASWGHGGLVGRWSAGCLVDISLESHKQFMQICKSDPNYKLDKRYRFSTILLDASKVLNS